MGPNPLRHQAEGAMAGPADTALAALCARQPRGKTGAKHLNQNRAFGERLFSRPESLRRQASRGLMGG